MRAALPVLAVLAAFLGVAVSFGGNYEPEPDFTCEPWKHTYIEHGTDKQNDVRNAYIDFRKTYYLGTKMSGTWEFCRDFCIKKKAAYFTSQQFRLGGTCQCKKSAKAHLLQKGGEWKKRNAYSGFAKGCYGK